MLLSICKHGLEYPPIKTKTFPLKKHRKHFLLKRSSRTNQSFRSNLHLHFSNMKENENKSYVKSGWPNQTNEMSHSLVW
jgi:hypothetical protein